MRVLVLAALLAASAAWGQKQVEETHVASGSDKTDACKYARDAASLWVRMQALQCTLRDSSIGSCDCEKVSSSSYKCLVVSKGTCDSGTGSSRQPSGGSRQASGSGREEVRNFGATSFTDGTRVQACGWAKERAEGYARANGASVIGFSACDCAIDNDRNTGHYTWQCSVDARLRKN